MEGRSIIVDMLGNGNPEIQLRQGDKGIPIAFYVYEGGKGVDLGEWDTCTLDVQDEDGTLITQVHCEIGEDAVTCKVSPLMTEIAGDFCGRLVLENDDARMSSGDIGITIIGSRKATPKTDISLSITTVTERNEYKEARKVFEDAKDLLDGLMVEAEASRGNYDAARKLLEEATKTYGMATKAREDGMKILSKTVSDLEEAKGQLKDRVAESANVALLLQKATEEKQVAEKAYRQTAKELEKRLGELGQYKPQEATKEATKDPEAALMALGIASSTRKAVEDLSAALEGLKVTVASLALRKEV